MENKMIWMLNTSEIENEVFTNDPSRPFIKFIPGHPQQVDEGFALKLITKFRGMRICDNPERYFTDKPQKVMIQRDGGIGDLLLLEPIIRKMKTVCNRIMSVLSINTDVYLHNPFIDNLVTATHKDAMPVKAQDYDFWNDYRNYSEQHPERNKKHRTDIYAMRNGLNLDDKNPRLYFSKDEKNTVFVKEPGKTYIGLAMDGSHSYRRYDRGNDLIKHILESSQDNIAVVFGSWDFVKTPANDRVIDLQGKTTVREMILAVRALDYLISVDTGIMHIGLTLHVPTVGMFSICSPEFRITYYDGPKKILCKKELTCIGCGDSHMLFCKYGDKNKNPEFIPECMNFKVEDIYKSMLEMPKSDERRCFYPDNEKEIKPVNVNILTDKKLTMPVILLNEEKNLPRFIELVISNPMIGRVIAIDGGSNDKSVELLEKAGAEVHVHPYIKTYHDQQAQQRNISCSYVRNGEPIFILDLDECFSKELSDYLPFLAEQRGRAYGLVHRRTFAFYADINDPSKQIKNFPDPQPRYYIWDEKFKFVGGAHHRTLNVPAPFMIDKPIIHFEREGKDREAIEAQWSGMMSEVRRIQCS